MSEKKNKRNKFKSINFWIVIAAIVIIVYWILINNFYPTMWDKNIEYFSYIGFIVSLVSIWIGVYIAGKIHKKNDIVKQNMSRDYYLKQLHQLSADILNLIHTGIPNNLLQSELIQKGITILTSTELIDYFDDEFKKDTDNLKNDTNNNFYTLEKINILVKVLIEKIYLTTFKTNLETL